MAGEPCRRLAWGVAGCRRRNFMHPEYSSGLGSLVVLDGVDLTVPEGQFTAFVGPSGCGKTTFLRIIAGLEPTTSGAIRIDGQVIDRPSADRGFVFQTDNLLPWRTVLSNARLGHELAGTMGAEERIRTLCSAPAGGPGGLRIPLSGATLRWHAAACQFSARVGGRSPTSAYG